MADPTIVPKRVLQLTLLWRWFNEIVGGNKTTEFRVKKPYWDTRLLKSASSRTATESRFREFDEVWFRNGYSQDRPFMRVEWKGCDEVIFENAPHYAIRLGKILEIKNYG